MRRLLVAMVLMLALCLPSIARAQKKQKDPVLHQYLIEEFGKLQAQITQLNERLGTLETQMVPHFFKSVAVAARLTLHMALLYGENDHHKCEALFKSCGRALADAVTLEPRRAGVSSTKGVL